MAILCFILLLISFFFNWMWTNFFLTYLRNWPEMKEEFDKYMQDLYDKYVDS